jgi:putative membrane protein
VKALDAATARKVIAGLSVFVIVAVAVVLYVVPHPTRSAAASDGPDTLATVNAVLNGASAIGLLLGFAAIRQRRVDLHRLCMSTSFVLSSIFLVTYLVHHARVGSVKFQGAGVAKALYLVLLIPHVVLAAAIVPLALTTLYRGLTSDIARHRAIARRTLPLWLYVSLSGVLLYLMLYHVT